jgi:hypothetical protein
VLIPPTPTTGTGTARATCQTIRSASGLIAGPLRPPVTLQRHGIRPRLGRRPRDRHHVGDVGRQLRQDRQRADLAHPPHHAPRQFRVGGEINAARDVGARQVQLQSRQSVRPPDHRGHLDELVLVLTRDVGNHRGRQRTQVGQVVGQEVLDAVVVQADGVEHARRRFDGPRRRVAGPRPARDRLGDDAAEPGEIDDAGHLPGVTERPRRDQDGVREAQPAEGDGEVHF